MSKEIKLDSWSIDDVFFHTPDDFQERLEFVNKEIEAETLDPDEVVIPSLEATITITQPKISFKVFADRMKKGITRKKLQFSIQNALSKVNLGDHRYPEVLELKKNGTYDLFLAS